jgi:hypothetical protein
MAGVLSKATTELVPALDPLLQIDRVESGESPETMAPFPVDKAKGLNLLQVTLYTKVRIHF